MSDREFDLAIMTHDLRNNASGALSFLNLFQRENPEFSADDKLQHALEGIQRAIEISNEISLQAEYGADRAVPPGNTQEITSVFTQLKDYMAAEYKQLNRLYAIDIHYSYKLIPEEKFFAINQARIASLRDNIINNAINAGATRLDAHYEMRSYAMVVTFTDNGSGMKQELIDQLMLQQLGDGKVHGLGTRSILNAVSENGYVLSYRSHENVGTTVRVLCPYVEI